MSCTEVSRTEPTTHFDTLSALVDDAVARLEGQVLLSAGRCVDDLLDMWNATLSQSARQIVAEALMEIGHQSAVRAECFKVRARLVQLAAAVDEVFDHLELRV